MAIKNICDEKLIWSILNYQEYRMHAIGNQYIGKLWDRSIADYAEHIGVDRNRLVWLNYTTNPN